MQRVNNQSTSGKKYGIIGSGSWGTALAKILTDNGQSIHWWNRSEEAIRTFQKRGHNPQYLSAARFDMSLLTLSADLASVIHACEVLIVAVPSAYIHTVLSTLPTQAFAGKKILSAVKGILPERNQLLHEYLAEHFNVPLSDYLTVMGPCHAEEIAAEKLSYLTFSGTDAQALNLLLHDFKTAYVQTVANPDVLGVQYAAVLKNIYALAAGIAHGLEYGDNFLSVLTANAAREMAAFLQQQNHSGNSLQQQEASSSTHRADYAASVYLGDLLVTCYSPYSRNRQFGAMIGKGYSVKAAQLEMNMVAEGYNASRCMHQINQAVGAAIPIADTVFAILWDGVHPATAFSGLESKLF